MIMSVAIWRRFRRETLPVGAAIPLATEQDNRR
jgi:hypothetical protein